ncbi:MAG TPA: AzlC family ABC transporter permease [Paracoccaceae bacterium]|nr:AzlC family ABC transporter permease [Paracoccaceae bacterium]
MGRAGQGKWAGGALRGAAAGFADMAPVALFILPFGLGFGAAAVERGLTAAQAVAMSALAFSGTAQFAVLDLWTVPGGWLTLALVTLALSARLTVMGAVLGPVVNAAPRGQRLAALALLSDANFARHEAALRAGEGSLPAFAGAGLALWSAWVAGTAAGAGLGRAAGDMRALGIDMILVAFFAATLAVMLGKAARPRFGAVAGPVAVGALVAVAAMPVLPAGWNVVAAALAGGVLAAMRGDRHGA